MRSRIVADVVAKLTTRHPGAVVGLLATLLLVAPAAGREQGPTDSYLRGYVEAIVQREFDLAVGTVSVRDGTVTIDVDLSDAEAERLRSVLADVEGIRRVVIRPAQALRSATAWFPGQRLFAPLLADPRWPRFSASYHYYIGDDELTHVAATNFGEQFPLLLYNPQYGGSWEIGLQAGVFAIFDLATSSFDLINADYFGAIPVVYKRGDYAVLGRFFHQSSHLGDEFLLRNRERRINLSYEGIDAVLSAYVSDQLRLYGGGGYLVRVDPGDLGRGSVQTGVEYVGREPAWGVGTPVGAVDVQLREEDDWRPNVSPRVGLQFGQPFGFGRSLQMFAEYFDGKSPNGQFYDRTIRYLGLGFHLNL